MASSPADRSRPRVAPRRRAATVDPTEKGLPVGTLAELANLMRELGHDPWELLESFGVTPPMMAQPLTPIPMAVHGRILQAAADATGRDTVGLMLGQRARLDNTGPLKLLVFNARTMREAVESLVRYVGLWYHGIRLRLTRDGGFACLSVAAEGDFPGRDALLIAYVAASVNHLEAILGRSWRPSQVHMACRRPPQVEAYTRFFRAPVLFDQPRYAIYFADAALDALRAGSDRSLDAFLRQHFRELEAREPADFVGRVRGVIADLLAGGECTVQRVAELFAVHRVTLHRRLREHGTTFEALLDESRRDLAGRMLEHTSLSVGDIASALGYGASGSFVRAFSRWHGATPGSWRRQRPARGRGGS
ncbi:MAG: AraC family transcriptional regulator [Burkholderiales bacterium]|nr:AraC family transcriptional regulator [Burkholderiales bacterium]